jgi:hypothetical protein
MVDWLGRGRLTRRVNVPSSTFFFVLLLVTLRCLMPRRQIVAFVVETTYKPEELMPFR